MSYTVTQVLMMVYKNEKKTELCNKVVFFFRSILTQGKVEKKNNRPWLFIDVCCTKG